MPRLYLLASLASLALAVMAVACTGGGEPAAPASPTVAVSATTQPANTLAPTPPATPTPAPTRPPTATPTPRPAPTATPELVPTPAPSSAGEITSTEIYARVAPSVAFIDTPFGTGSGFLVAGDYVVTNYHVVWPLEEVRIVFPDGADLLAPVAAWDPMHDIAVLGPVNAAVPPLELRDGEQLALGSEIFLLGYPGETDSLPDPAIVSGLLSHFRQWNRLGLTYFQTDVVMAGGQSGGVMVDTQGEVIGISGWSYTEADYALVASAADLKPIVQRLIAGRDPSGVSNRRFREAAGRYQFSGDLQNHWDARTFLLEASSGETFELEIDSTAPMRLHVTDPDTNILLEMDNGFGGVENGSAEVLADGHHFLTVETSLHNKSAGYDLTSNVPMYPFTDPDDGRRLRLHETIAGNIDHQQDVDWFSIQLDAGEKVIISSDSPNVDTIVHVDFPNSRVNQVVHDDDSGGGMFGVNARLVYLARHGGEHHITVRGYADRNPDYGAGGYLLSVDQAPTESEAVTAPTSPREVDSPFGKMIVYESSLSDFSVQAPADWIEVWPDEDDSVTAFKAQQVEGFAAVLIMEFDMAAADEVQTLEEPADSIEAGVSEVGADIEVQRKNIVTSSGVPTVALDLKARDEPLAGRFLITIQDERFAFVVGYLFEDGESAWPLVEYSLGTLQSSASRAAAEPGDTALTSSGLAEYAARGMAGRAPYMPAT